MNPRPGLRLRCQALHGSATGKVMILIEDVQNASEDSIEKLLAVPGDSRHASTRTWLSAPAGSQEVAGALQECQWSPEV